MEGAQEISKGATTMSQYIQSTIADMKGGRETWRVLALFTVPAFIIAFTAAIVSSPF
jgi:hypothetical protein